MHRYFQTIVGKSDEWPARPMIVATTRTGRLLIVGILLSSLLLAMLIQAQLLPQITVDEMLGEASAHENNEVHVRGCKAPIIRGW